MSVPCYTHQQNFNHNLPYNSSSCATHVYAHTRNFAEVTLKLCYSSSSPPRHPDLQICMMMLHQSINICMQQVLTSRVTPPTPAVPPSVEIDSATFTLQSLELKRVSPSAMMLSDSYTHQLLNDLHRWKQRVPLGGLQGPLYAHHLHNSSIPP